MIIEAVKHNSKSTSHAGADTAPDLDPLAVPPTDTYESQSHLVMDPVPFSSPSPSSQDMPSTTTSSPISVVSASPLYPQVSTQRQQRLYRHPVLHVSTIPYDFQPSASERSSLLSSSFAVTKLTRHAFTRFFTSFFVALGIIFLWLLFVQSIRILVFGYPGSRWGPPSHYEPLPPRTGHLRPVVPVVVKPSFGTSRPYVAYSTRYSSVPSATPSMPFVLPTSTDAASSGAGRVVVTADR